MLTRVWVIEDNIRPWTTNSERTWHHHKRAKMVRETRERWYLLAKRSGIPTLSQITVAVIPMSRDRRWRPDVGACYPTVKAAIDGIVDAGIIPDDNPQHLYSITFYAVDVNGRDGMRLVIGER